MRKNYYDVGGVYEYINNSDGNHAYWMVFNSYKLRDCYDKNHKQIITTNSLFLSDANSDMVSKYNDYKKEYYSEDGFFVFTIENNIVFAKAHLGSPSSPVFGKKVAQIDCNSNMFKEMRSYILENRSTNGYELLDNEEDMIKWLMEVNQDHERVAKITVKQLFQTHEW